MNGYAVSEWEVSGRKAARNASVLTAAVAAVNAVLTAMVFIGGSPFFPVFLDCVFLDWVFLDRARRMRAT